MVKKEFPALHGEGIDIDELADVKLAALDVKKPVILKDLKGIPRGLFRDRKNKSKVRIVGAAGEVSPAIPQEKLRTMSDPYDHTTRKAFNDCAYTDPVISPALERRHDALFEDGYELQLELKSMFDKATGKKLTPEEVRSRMEEMEQKYLGFLQQIRDWDEKMNIEKKMMESNIASLVQGRSAALIVPGFANLAQGKLPIAVQVIHWEDISEPIVDIGLTHRIVALRANYNNKKIIRPDEMVYFTRKAWGLRKESEKWGSGSFEAILVISRAIKRIYNFDIPEAVLSSYITKLIFEFGFTGTGDEDVENKISTFLTNYFTNGKLAFGTTQAVTKITPVKMDTDSGMMQLNEGLLAQIELAVIGVPKSMLNRQENLNRDLATIEAIQFMKFVRKPDERLVSKAFEDQLYNPALAHLAGESFDSMPVRIRVVSLTEDPADDLAADKAEEINTQEIAQPGDTEKTMGASGAKPSSLIQS